MTPEQRTAYWSAAIAKAREAWPNDPWGIALNSTERRTQCHMHLHIGKLLPNLADENFVVVDGPADIPVPARWRWCLDPSRRRPPARPRRSAQRRTESGKIRTPMLVEITKVPNAENSAIHLHPTDNVAVARVPLPAGTELRVDGLPRADSRRHSRRPQGRAVGHRAPAKWWSATAR